MASTMFQSGTVMITGALSDIGEELALAFASQGCTSIFLADVVRDGASLAQLAGKIEKARPGTKCHHAAIEDGQLEESVAALVDECIQKFGGLDHAVNIALDTTERKALLETSSDGFDSYVSGTMVPAFFLQQYQIKAMLKYPGQDRSIVNVVSVLGLATTGLSSLEATGHHGVLGFTRSGALDCATLGIRVNGVCPGPLETLEAKDPARAAVEIKKLPFGRLTRVADVVGPVVFLSSSAAAGINGHCLPVDGGWMLRHI